MNEKKLEELTVINRNYRKVQKMLLKLAPKMKEKGIEAKGEGTALKDSIKATVQTQANVLDEYKIVIYDDEGEFSSGGDDVSDIDE